MEKKHWLNILEVYFGGAASLESYGDVGYWVRKRKEGRSFPFEAHLKAFIYALLTNQREWSGIAAKIEEINALFFQFDKEMVKRHDATYFMEGIFRLKCGNVATKRQMGSLHENIRKMEAIEKDYGSLDKFVTSADANTIVRLLSDSHSKYKLSGLGVALAWEYLRNVGVDGAKPDTHLRRFLSVDRVGTGSKKMATEEEVISQVDELAKITHKEKWLIDGLIWEYCNVEGASICGADPDCHRCVIRSYCHRNV